MRLDNSAAFWRYNRGPARDRKRPSSAKAVRLTPRHSLSPFQVRRMDERKRRQHQFLTALIEADGRLIHVDRLAQRSDLSPSAVKAFLISHHDGLWLPGKNAAWWRTTLRRIPDRLQ